MDHRESPISGVPPAVPDVDVQDNPSSPDDDASPASPGSHPTVPSLRPTPDTPGGITASSTHLGQINAARRGAPAPLRPHASMSAQPSGLNPDILAKMKAFSLSRQGAPPSVPHSFSTDAVPKSTQESVSGPPDPGQSPTGSLAGPPSGKPPVRPAPMKNVASSPAKPGGLAEKRRKPGLKLSDANGPNGPDGAAPAGGGAGESAFTKYSDLIDAKAGTLNFKDKALIHGGGIQFSSGHNFNISLDEVDRLDELGKGNYGTVYKVRHSRPHMRKPGLGLGGIVSRSSTDNVHSETSTTKPHDTFSGVVMAMKEIRLELDESKFSQIIMELDILHRCVSPFIIDFYGAFFQEGAVYICVEYMDGGSIDKLYKEGVPENILRKVTLSTIMGLRSLKDEHNIIHRDVKPTNFLVNTRGQIKICDFGVSGNLVASIAKTNIGCQSYMAPERIAGGGSQQPAGGGGTYSVQSDVWSLGLSIVECAIGRYPYPPETFTNIFSQLHAIVHGEAPKLPESTYSKEAHAFVRACMDKNPNKRPSYNMLLRHPWLSPLMRPPQESQKSSQTSGGAESPVTDDPEVADWVKSKIERCERGLLGNGDKPALHAVALDAVPGSPLLDDPTVSFPQP